MAEASATAAYRAAGFNLSPRQRECLRYVYDRLTSKEIAARTGLSPGTIDTYIAEAVAVLGAANRREAAALLYDHGRTTPGKSELEKSGVSANREVKDALATSSTAAGWAGLLPFRVKGSRGNDLNPAYRLLVILGIAISIAVALGMLAIALRVIGAAYAGGTAQ